MNVSVTDGGHGCYAAAIEVVEKELEVTRCIQVSTSKDGLSLTYILAEARGLHAR